MADLFNPPKEKGKLDHTDLQRRLYLHRTSMSKRPKCFQEVAISGSYGSQGRLDLVELMLGGSGNKADDHHVISIHGFEIKASRGDLLSDLRKQKWKRYLFADRFQKQPGYLHRLYFVMPSGIAEPHEIPSECGLIFYNEDHNNFGIARKAPTLPHKEPDDNLFVRLLWRDEGGHWDKDEKWLIERRERYESHIKKMDHQRSMLTKHYQDYTLAQYHADREWKLRKVIRDLVKGEDYYKVIEEALGYGAGAEEAFGRRR